MNIADQKIIWKRRATGMSSFERQETIVALHTELWELKAQNKRRENIVEEQLQILEQIMINTDKYVKSLEQKIEFYELREKNN